MIRRFELLALVLLAALSGCARFAMTHVPATQMAATDNAAQRWRATGDYYALLELVDIYIDPNWYHRNVTKADVIKYLGEGLHDPDDYPNAGPNFWVYTSRRPVPYGSYLYVEFGDDGFVKSVSWGSE